MVRLDDWFVTGAFSCKYSYYEIIFAVIGNLASAMTSLQVHREPASYIPKGIL